jgi:hypothetical protein
MNQEPQVAVERILEDESLTAELVDPAATTLLDWGVKQAEAIARRSGAQAELDTRLNALRHMLKRIGQCAGQSPPKAQNERVKKLLNLLNNMEQNPEVQNDQ